MKVSIPIPVITPEMILEAAKDAAGLAREEFRSNPDNVDVFGEEDEVANTAVVEVMQIGAKYFQGLRLVTLEIDTEDQTCVVKEI